jgi:hypothetical protein
MIWRSGALPGGQALEPRLTYAIDWDLSLRLLSNGLPAGVQRPLVGYRQHGGNMSIGAARFLSELEVIDEKFRDMRQGRALDVAGEYRNAGSELARAGHKRKAMSYYFGAARRGDAGAVLRAAGIMMPRRLWPLLRRRFLSNEEWLGSAEQWLSPHRAKHRTPEPALSLLQTN